MSATQSMSEATPNLPDPTRPFACDMCPFTFKRKYPLERHKKRHGAEKEYACDYPGCDYAAYEKRPLQVHQRVEHTGEKSEVCQEPGCTERYSSASSLLDHKKARHNYVPRPYVRTNKVSRNSTKDPVPVVFPSPSMQYEKSETHESQRERDVSMEEDDDHEYEAFWEYSVGP